MRFILTILLAGLSLSLPAAQDPGAFEINNGPTYGSPALAKNARLWHERFWHAVESPRWKQELETMAASGDIFAYGRPFNTNMTAVLSVQRETGDLRLLDEMDRYMQLARAQLQDYNKDGFLNWRYLNRSANARLFGDDVGASSMWEMETHALVSAVAYSFRQNERKRSPSGVDYKERADFWQGYLKNHFEAKWRQRNNVPAGFPFLERNLTHPFTNFIRYHFYMGLLTGERGYGEYAGKMYATLQAYTEETATPDGPALVWQHQLLSTDRACQPTLYARLTLLAIQDLSRAGFSPLADKGLMRKYARTVSELMSLDSLTMKKDVCGEEGKGAIVSNPRTGEFGKPAAAITAEIFNASYTAGLLQWEEGNKIERFCLLVYEKIEKNPDRPTHIMIPAAMFMNSISKTKTRGKPIPR